MIPLKKAVALIQNLEAIENMTSILLLDWNGDVGSEKRKKHSDVRKLKIIHNNDITFESLAVNQQGLCEKSSAYLNSHPRTGMTF